MIVALCSGEGRTFAAVTRVLGTHVKAMITNVENAPVREKAKALGVQNLCVPHSSFSSRAAHEQVLLSALEQCAPFRIVALLGYMRVLSEEFLNAFHARWPQATLINLHPAPLTLYKGAQGLMHAVRCRAPLWGVSVHRVTAQLDSGPLLAFRSVPIYPNDTFEDLRERAHPCEVSAVLEAIDTLTRRHP